MRRLAIFVIHPKDLSDMLRGDTRLGIPKDTKIVDVRINFHRDMIELKLEHPSFPEIEPGTIIPERAFNIIVTGEIGGYRVPEQFRKGVEALFSGADQPVVTASK